MMHINRFIDRIKVYEAKNQKDFVMPMRDAKDLHTDITKLLLVLQESHNTKPEEITQVIVSSDNW